MRQKDNVGLTCTVTGILSSLARGKVILILYPGLFDFHLGNLCETQKAMEGHVQIVGICTIH